MITAFENIQEISKQLAVVFKRRNWRWWDRDNPFGMVVPEAKQIREAIGELSNDLNKDDVDAAGMGRIRIRRKEGKIFVSVEGGPNFELTEANP